MPRNPNDKRVEVLLSPAQYEVLARLADENKMGLADLVRQTLLKTIPSLPNDFVARGKYKRNADNAR